MSDNGYQQFSEELNYIYSTLNPQDVEQFYADYQRWWTQQRMDALQEQIGLLRLRISENAQRLQQVQPPAVAFATLARLQAKGVNDIDLLDRLLERGEEWLDLTMQRLDYCEQLDFIHDNYTQWCEHALEGAYDWIDSMRDADASTVPRLVVTAEVNDTNVEATEELLLHKLTSEEEISSVEITLKRPAVSLVPTAEEILPEPALLDDIEARSTAHSAEEPVPTPADGPQQESYLQESEMVLPAEANAGNGTSLISTEHAKEDEYIEFAPSTKTGEEAGTPQGLEEALIAQADEEVVSTAASKEQGFEDQYVETVSALEAWTEEAGLQQESSLQEIFPDVEEPVIAPEESIFSEADVFSSADIEQADGYVESVPPSLHLETTTRIDEITTSVKAEEPELSEAETNHVHVNVQVTTPENSNLPAPAQEMKVQRRHSLRQRLLAIFWP
jgi:hypothetical protein